MNKEHLKSHPRHRRCANFCLCNFPCVTTGEDRHEEEVRKIRKKKDANNGIYLFFSHIVKLTTDVCLLIVSGVVAPRNYVRFNNKAQFEDPNICTLSSQKKNGTF